MARCTARNGTTVAPRARAAITSAHNARHRGTPPNKRVAERIFPRLATVGSPHRARTVLALTRPSAFGFKSVSRFISSTDALRNCARRGGLRRAAGDVSRTPHSIGVAAPGPRFTSRCVSVNGAPATAHGVGEVTGPEGVADEGGVEGGGVDGDGVGA